MGATGNGQAPLIANVAAWEKTPRRLIPATGVKDIRGPVACRRLTILEPDGGLLRWSAFVLTTTVEGQAALFGGCEDTSPLLVPLFAP